MRTPRSAAVWILLAAARAGAAEQPAAAVPVVIGVVAREAVAEFRTGIGTVQPAQSVTVRARVDGQLERVAFSEGQDVHRGDLLAQLDSRPFEATLNQTLAQKARDEASLTAAQKDLERYTTLVAQGSLQRQALDSQQATVGQLRATLQADQAAIDNARVQLGYTRIVAPISGRTGLRLVDAGNMVHATDTTGLVIINQIDPIAVLFTLPETDFSVVNQALRASGSKPLEVAALARDDSSVLGTGRLLLVNNRIDSASGTFQLKAMLPNAAHALWPGQYVNARLTVSGGRDSLTVPAGTVQRGQDGLFAYVVGADGTVATRAVRAHTLPDGRSVIDEGLSAGQRVVVDGQFKIRPGVRVSNIAAGAKPGP